MNRIKSVFVRNLVSGSLDSASSSGIDNIPTRNYTIFATRANEDNGWKGETKREIRLDLVYYEEKKIQNYKAILYY